MKSEATKLRDIINESFNKLEKISEEKASVKPLPNKWSAKELIGHLIDSATNNHHRFVRAQEINPLTFPKYEQDFWVRSQSYNNTAWPELLNFWKFYNLHISHVIKNMDSTKLDTVCNIGEYEPVDLKFLVIDYIDHLNHHLNKLYEQI